MAIAQSVAQCTICTSMSGLAGRLGHADAVARPAQGDQQARHPNAAPHHRLRGCAEDRTKKPRQGRGRRQASGRGVRSPGQFQTGSYRRRLARQSSVSQKILVDFRARDLARKRPARAANSFHEPTPQTKRQTGVCTPAPPLCRSGPRQPFAR